MQELKLKQSPQTALWRNTNTHPKSNKTSTKSWAHLVAGACGGIVTATATSPLDVLRTRLQADFYRTHSTSGNTPFHYVRDTLQILYSIRHSEGWRGLFRGLGPSLTGVVPASAVKFYTYGNCKQLACNIWRLDPDSAVVHAIAASTAGMVTGVATNPIWLVKTRLQLDKARVGNAGRRYRNSMDCVTQVLRQEGIRGLYRGLSASFLGAAETTLHLVLYEQMKIHIARCEKTSLDRSENWIGVSAAAGISKLLAALVAYPHEVIRTRLRQAPIDNGSLKYTGLIQSFRLTWQEGGLASLYGGLTPHILRAVPSAAISLGVYELVLELLS